MQHPHCHCNKATPNGQVLTNAGCNAFRPVSFQISTQGVRWKIKKKKQKKKKGTCPASSKVGSSLVPASRNLRSKLLSLKAHTSRQFHRLAGHVTLQPRARTSLLRKTDPSQFQLIAFHLSCTSVGTGPLAFLWCAEILFLQARKIRTNQRRGAAGCRHGPKTLRSSCLQEARLNLSEVTCHRYRKHISQFTAAEEFA